MSRRLLCHHRRGPPSKATSRHQELHFHQLSNKSSELSASWSKTVVVYVASRSRFSHRLRLLDELRDLVDAGHLRMPEIQTFELADILAAFDVSAPSRKVLSRVPKLKSLLQNSVGARRFWKPRRLIMCAASLSFRCLRQETSH